MGLNTAVPYGRPTVLVVDDSRAVLEGLCNLLRADCNALFGFNGLEALALATSESPDLIVLDVAMPGMDGYEVLRRLKEDPSTRPIPVIFLTAPGPGVSETRALELGAIDFITKPYDPSILKARIHNQLAYKRSLDQAMALSLGDALTGIPNRRRFDEHFAQEWNRAVRSKKPMSMILMDIDYFKRFNDALGHPAGDACLQGVAEALRASLKRSTDFIARYGGEEFACILSETDIQGARDVAMRIADSLATAAIAHPDSPISPVVTLSMGVATVVPDPGLSPGDILSEADSRLYEAKRLGRNRIQSEPMKKHPTGSSETLSILLVEGDTAQQAILLEELAGVNREVQVVPNAAEAMTALLQKPRALILSATTLAGGMDGYALCQWAKKDPALNGIPFAILGSSRGDSWARSFQAGADDYFFKQEDAAVLRVRVRLLLALGEHYGMLRAHSSGTDFLLLSPPGPMRSTMISLLSQEGIRTTFAANLEEALPALQNQLPDALILDLDLLDLDPAETLDHMRAVPGCDRLPILVMANTDHSLLVDALESRIQDRIETPLNPAECRHRFRMLARFALIRDKKEESRTLTQITLAR